MKRTVYATKKSTINYRTKFCEFEFCFIGNGNLLMNVALIL